MNYPNKNTGISDAYEMYQTQVQRRVEARQSYGGGGRTNMQRHNNNGGGNNNNHASSSSIHSSGTDHTSHSNKGHNLRSRIHRAPRTKKQHLAPRNATNSVVSSRTNIPGLNPVGGHRKGPQDPTPSQFVAISTSVGPITDDDMSLGWDASSVQGENNAAKRNKKERKYRSRIADLERELASLKTDKADIESKLQNSNSRMEKLATQRDTAVQRVKEKESDASELMKTLRTMQESATTREDRVHAARRAAEEKAAKAEQELSQIRGDLSIARHDVATLQKQLHDAENERESYSHDLAAAQNELLSVKNSNNVHMAQLQLEKELRAKAEQNEVMERNERVAMSAQMVAMTTEHASFEVRVREEYESNERELRVENTDLKVNVDEINEELSSIRESLLLVESERKSLRDALAAKDTEEAKVIEENGRLKGEIEVLMNRLQASEAKYADLDARNTITINGLEEKVREGEALRRRMHNTIQELRGNVRVYARVRPFLPIDGVGNDDLPCVVCKGDSNMTISNNENNSITSFEFDRVFAPSSGQDAVFKEASEFVQSALDGFNVCLFSYGQTGSGKTHTMQGSGVGQMRGIIPRAIEQVGRYKTDLEADGWRYSMSVTFLEIYNETVRDLLRDKEDTNLTYDIKVHPDGERYITNITRKDIDPTNTDAIEDIMRLAAKFRTVSATGMNDVSSRSHSVFTLQLRAVHAERRQKLKGQLNLVDLAGSERLARSGATGDQAKETVAINKSLSSLADVFAALGRKASHIPYRNSKLTYLLQPCLSGDGKTLMMVNLSPTEASYQESLSTLRFAKQVNQCELGKASRSIKDDDGDDNMSVSSGISSASRLSRGTTKSAPTPKTSTHGTRRPASGVNTPTPKKLALSSGIPSPSPSSSSTRSRVSRLTPPTYSSRSRPSTSMGSRQPTTPSSRVLSSGSSKSKSKV